ncbi:acyltransferase family protein [Mesoflavibacter profundi]|uniref:Acyltransferase n=1 Tax=Mesoflavibacter profundi TaxID=2708110 RepID=A0ABT4RWG7_9FLAO|nr:acyltransferase [Mesoflavibacter profundi]MDA0176174.1 acyltransferase [Mesoflavibacter profundi]
MKAITTYKHRIFGLDVVRAIAILLILCSHSTILLFPNSEATLVKFIQFFGTIGVDIFFVLSGFLIGTILIKHIESNQIKPRHFVQFWVRRWLRTLPNYYLILVINIGLAFLYKTEIPNQLFHYFFFLQNGFHPMPDFFTESWSLTIEEFAYLLGPILLMLIALFVKRLNKWSFLIMTFIVIIAFILSKIIFHFNTINIIQDFNWSHSLRKVVITRIDSIYYGFIGAFLSMYYTTFWNKIKYKSFILGSLSFVIIHAIIFINKLNPDNYLQFFNIWYLPLVSISILMCFPLVSNWKKQTNSIITKISLWSYSLYLVNYSIVLLTFKHIVNLEHSSGIFKLIILIGFWSISFVLSYILYTYFERPIIEFRNNLNN